MSGTVIMQLLKNHHDLDSFFLCFVTFSSMVCSQNIGIIYLPDRKMREEKKQWMGPLILPEKNFFFPGSTGQANFHLPLIVTETALGPKSKTLRMYLKSTKKQYLP